MALLNINYFCERVRNSMSCVYGYKNARYGLVGMAYTNNIGELRMCTNYKLNVFYISDITKVSKWEF